MKKELEKIYYNFRELGNDYQDMEETKKAGEELMSYLEKQFDRPLIIKLEPYITKLCSENEKQGFMNGFEYSVKLLTKIGE